MAVSSVPLTAFSEDQRAQARTRFTIIRPALEDGVTQAQVARPHNIPVSTVKRWVKRYCEKGLAGLADAKGRSDKGKSRCLPLDGITLIEGLALQKPPRSMAAIHRQVTTVAFEQRFRTWLLEDYHTRFHVEIKCKPQERWEAEGFLPRTPKSLEKLDLLLLTVAKTRRVQQDGIRFQGYRYLDPTLAGYVKEEVVIRLRRGIFA